MDLVQLFGRARDLYLEPFRRFVETHAATSRRGSAEVIFEVPEPSGLYRRLARVDFVRNDETPEAIWFETDTVLTVESGAESLGSMTLRIETLRWDDVVIHHDLLALPEMEIAAWFEAWFDPNDVRCDPDSAVGSLIHSLSMVPGALSVDFGSAPTEALWQLLELVERSGGAAVTINDEFPASH